MIIKFLNYLISMVIASHMILDNSLGIITIKSGKVERTESDTRAEATSLSSPNFFDL